MRYFDPSAFQVECSTLNAVVKAGVYDPSLTVFNRIDSNVFKYATENFEKHAYPANKDLLYDARSQRYVESNFAVYKADPEDYLLLELARISVPRGSVGYLKTVEQFCADFDQGFYPTAAQFLGIPFQDISDLDSLRWYLRLEQFNGRQPARLVKSSSTPINVESDLPGYPYVELSEIVGLWHFPHIRQQLSCIIPGAYLLRFFVYSPPTHTFTFSFSGRLTANVQSALSSSAVFNTQKLS